MGSNTARFTLEHVRDVLIRHNGLRAHAAQELGVSDRCIVDYIRRMKAAGLDPPESGYRTRNVQPVPGLKLPQLPEGDLSIDELRALRRRSYEVRHEYEQATKLIPITVTLDGPIGIHFFGDPHIDDDGCDFVALERDTELVRKTDGMFAANVGDSTNNWVGRLGTLYAHQQVTARQAWKLAEWWIGELRQKWLFLVGGNHDLWSGAGDPIAFMCAAVGGMYQPSQVRIALTFPNGKVVRVNCRHDFAGSSIYNPAHGPMKAGMMGYRDHVSIAGHYHKSGYGVWRDPDEGTVCHAIQVSSYKRHDEYAKKRGFPDQTISPSATLILNPEATEAGLVHLFWDALEAAEYLRFLRRKRK